MAALGAVVVPSAGAVVAYLGRLKNAEQSLERRIIALEVKMEPLWKVINEEVPKLLIHPDAPDFDHLVQKFLDRTITLEEAKTLRESVKDRVKEPSEERLALVLFLSGVEYRIAELEKGLYV